MTIGKAINKLRSDANLSQEQFATLFGVSQQSVQKWENGDSVPELSKIIKISKHFGVSLDALILGNDNRIVEGMKGTNRIKPQYANIHDWEFYSSNLMTEYQQSIEEGLDIETYKDVFSAAARLPKDAHKKKIGDTLFEIVINAKQKEGYPYIEPSDLESIKDLRKPYSFKKNAITNLESKIHGAWMGRICGCMLGKTVEGIRTNELIPFLKETGNYPMRRYILRSDLNEEIQNKYKFHFASTCYADTIDGMPVDDDTNYTVLYQEIIQKYSRDFTPFGSSFSVVFLCVPLSSDVCLIGNVNCGLLQSGSDEDCYGDAMRALKEGMANGRGYIFSTSNCAYTGLALERYEMINKVWHEFGNYDHYPTGPV